MTHVADVITHEGKLLGCYPPGHGKHHWLRFAQQVVEQHTGPSDEPMTEKDIRADVSCLFYEDIHVILPVIKEIHQ